MKKLFFLIFILAGIQSTTTVSISAQEQMPRVKPKIQKTSIGSKSVRKKELNKNPKRVKKESGKFAHDRVHTSSERAPIDRTLFAHCEGAKVNRIQKLIFDSSQIAILDYDRGTHLLSFNTYRHIAISPHFLLKLSPKGLVFELSSQKASEVIRRYSTGGYRLQLELLLKVPRFSKAVACVKQHSSLVVKANLLRASIVDGKGQIMATVRTKLGRNLSAKAKHFDKVYLGKGRPKLTIDNDSESLKDDVRELAIEKLHPLLTRCYLTALEKNGRFQSTLIFRFNDELRIVDSNKDPVFEACVTEQVKRIAEGVTKDSKTKRVVLKAVFRLE